MKLLIELEVPDSFVGYEENILNKDRGVWNFVSTFYPNYQTSSEITLADDLQKIMDNEVDRGSGAEELLHDRCENSVVRAGRWGG
jgi:hypothetical protein